MYVPAIKNSRTPAGETHVDMSSTAIRLNVITISTIGRTTPDECP
jgi:hypothetical protein